MNLKRTFGLALISVSAFASAWNGNGHQQVADIAWAKLSRASRIEIAKILISGDAVSHGASTNAYAVPPPTAGFTDDYLEKTVRPVFRRAATWPDDIKSGTSSNYDARIDADNASSPGVHPPQAGSRRGEDNRCKTWHYYDDPINAPGDSAAHPARDSNAVRALGIVRPAFESQEKNDSPDRREQLYDLFWIEHLFGDLTQPLHCSESYVLDPKGDAGGNTFMTMAPNDYRPGSPENLHSYWDSGIDHAIDADPNLGKGADVEKVTATWIADPSAQPTPGDAKNLNPMAWVQEGRDLAVKYVYAGIQPMGIPDDTYKKNQVDLCKKQAVLAGTRLANYLNSVLKAKA
jgi:hypothetical protein